MMACVKKTAFAVVIAIENKVSVGAELCKMRGVRKGQVVSMAE